MSSDQQSKGQSLTTGVTSIAIALSLVCSQVAPARGHDYCGGPVPDSLRIATRSDDWHVRAQAYGTLKYYRQDDVYELLGQGLNDPDPRVICAALGDLTHCKSRYYEEYLDLITHDDPLVREHAAIALGRSGSPTRVEPLIGLLTDPVAKIRAYAVDALGHIKDERSREPLVATMDLDRSGFIRLRAAVALAEFGDMRAVPVLVEQVSPEVSQGLRRRVAQALSKLDCPDSRRTLLALLEDESSEVTMAAARSAATLKMHEALPRLRGLLEETPETRTVIREVYQTAIDGITKEAAAH